MSETYWAKSPLKDERYARNLCSNGNTDVSDYVKAFRIATEKNEVEMYEEANKKREDLVALKERLTVEIDLIPLDCQGQVAKVLKRVNETLDTCQTFPPPILNNPGAAKKNPTDTAIETAKVAITVPPIVLLPGEDNVSPGTNGSTSSSSISVHTASDEPHIPVATSGAETKNADEPLKISTVNVEQPPKKGEEGPPATRPKTTKGAKKSATAASLQGDPHHRSVSEVSSGKNLTRKKKKEKTILLEFIPDTVRDHLDLDKGPLVDANATEEELRQRRLAAFQRDSFSQKAKEYLDRITEQSRTLEKKLDRGEAFDGRDDDLFSAVMEEAGSYYREKSVTKRGNPDDASSYATRATNGANALTKTINPQDQTRKDYRESSQKVDRTQNNINPIHPTHQEGENMESIDPGGGANSRRGRRARLWTRLHGPKRRRRRQIRARKQRSRKSIHRLGQRGI